jgi:DNA-binding GntR family transcriptional regulator
VSGESLVIVLLALWVVLTAAVFVPAGLFDHKREAAASSSRYSGVEEFVEAIARGDFDAAEHAADAVLAGTRSPLTSSQ